MSPLAMRASIAITLGITAGVSLTCEPRVSVGDNSAATLNIALIGKVQNNPVFKWTNAGAKRAASVLGAGWIEEDSPQDMKPGLQQQSVQDVIDRRTAGIIISCIDDSLNSSIDEAMAKGIPVITFDSDCPNSRRLGFYGTENATAGRQAADLLVQAMNGELDEKRVAIVTGSERANNLNERIQGFKERLSEGYPNITILDPFHCEDEKPDTCSGLLDGVARDHQDLDGLFVVGLWGVQAACDECNAPSCACDVETRMPNWHAAVTLRNLKTVAFDALPFELELMKKHYLSALIGQKYYEWGYCTTSRMVKYITRGEPVKFSPAGYDVVANDQDVGRMISRWSEVYNGHVSASPADCGDGDAGP